MTDSVFEPVRVGVIGLGAFGQLHAQTLCGIAEAELVVVVERNPQTLERVQASCCSEVPGFQELDQALEASDAEAWVVASSTASHVDIATTLLAAGKHVLIEKPLAFSAADASKLSPLIDKNSTRLMLGHLLLFGSEFLGLNQEVQQRGGLSYLQSVRHRPATTRELYPGESPLRLLMVHDLYMTQVLMNGAEPCRMSAVQRFHREGGADMVQAHLAWDSGGAVSLTASFLTPVGMPDDGFDRMEVFGDGWMSRAIANPRPIEVWDDRARWPQGLEIRCDTDLPSGALADELRCFCQVVRGRRQVPAGTSYHDAMQVLRWMDTLETILAEA